MVDTLKPFWCYKVLPLVYDDSLSYYELLCKVYDKINEMIAEDTDFTDELNALRAEVQQIKTWIDNFDTSYAEQIIKEHIATMIFVEITDSGYITYYIPDNWDNITFNTTELDIIIPNEREYGRLVLSY